jgi:hypothetical protein
VRESVPDAATFSVSTQRTPASIPLSFALPRLRYVSTDCAPLGDTMRWPAAS